MELSEMEKTLIHFQNLGLQVNEMKSKGVKDVAIGDYEKLLDAYIELLRYSENLISYKIKS